MAKGGDKKQEEIVNPLNDENWNAFIFVIYLDAGTTDTNAAKLTSLGDRISSGFRQRFTTVSRSEIIAWAIENTKINDACKDLKAALDSGTLESNLSDSILAKVVKGWLLSQKEEGVDFKNGKFKEAVGTEVDEKGKAKASKDAAGAGNKKAPPPAAKGGKTDVSPNGSAGSDSKRKLKLRERPGGPQKDRVTAIGDEPLDGPDCYYYFQDLNTLSFLTAFNEETCIPVDAIFRGVYDPSEAVGKKGEKEKSEEQLTNAIWSSLRARATQNLSETWRKTAWENLKNSDFKDPKDAFEVLSTRIYNLLEKRKTYESFFKYDQIYKIPSFDKESADLRYYEYLSSIANSGGVTNVEFILALALEHIGRANNLEENVEPNEFAIGSLKQLLDSELSRVGFGITTKPFEFNHELTQSLVTIEAQDKTQLQSFFMKSLESINVNPLELIRKIQKAYQSNKYINFTEKISDFNKTKPSQLQAESVKLMTEFLNNTSLKDLDSILAEKLLIQIELEKFCKSLQSHEKSEYSLREWKWFGVMNSHSILQAIENIKINRPEIHYNFASLPGKLLVILKSPGPIGCLEFHTSKSKRIRSKMGFSKFNDLYDFNSNSLEGEKPSMGDSGIASYDMKDKAFSIQQEFSYLYPANNTIISVIKKSISDLGKEMFTKVIFGETTLQVSGLSQSKNQTAYFTSSFSDGSVFSIFSKEGSLSIQFSDVNGRHYSFEKDGSITCRLFSKNSSSSNGKNKETKRVYLPSGVVIKHFAKATQVLYPDGSYASRLPGKEWVKVSRDEPEQKTSVETNMHTGDVDIGREDFVSISKKGNTIKVEHSCLTSIETQISKSCRITAPESAAIVFNASGEQEIILSKYFKVERKMENGATVSIKLTRNDIAIDILASGEATVKLSNEGYSKPIATDHNKIDLNWITGTVNFIDILGYEFMVREDGSTSIKKPAEPVDIPNYSFGGPLLKDALTADSPDSMIGNTPVFFAISPDGQNSYHLQRDIDQLLYFQGNHHQFSRILEEPGIIPGSIRCCSTKKFKADLVESQLIEYSQFTRYKSACKVEYSLITQECETLLSRCKDRNEVVPAEELGETMESKLEQTKNKFPFVYGMNKEATQLAILLKHLEKEDLANDPGLYVTKDMHKLLKKAKSIIGKSSVPAAPSTAEKPRQFRKRNGPYKVPKYFDSPEGKSFIVTTPASKNTANNNAVAEQNAKKEQSNKKETIGLENEKSMGELSQTIIEESLAPQVFEVSTADSPIAPLTELNSPQVVPEIAQEIHASMKEREIKPKVKKERKLELPASILGQKPGAIPNTTYLDREASVRRHINTVSTAQTRKQNSNYGSAGFMVRPALVKFGEIDISSGGKNTVSIVMTNVGLDSGRFKIKQPADSIVDIEYKHGPVAPGMAVTFNFKLKKGIHLKPNTQIDEEVKIVSEMEILHIPVKGKLIESKRE